MATSNPIRKDVPSPVAIFVPVDKVNKIVSYAIEEEIDIGQHTFQTKEELCGHRVAEAATGTVDFEKDRGHNAPNPLTDLFAQKIQSAFDLGHETLKSVLDSSLKVAAIFGTARASKALRPLASIAVNKLPGYITKLTPAIPGTDMLKFLGLFFIVKAALQPLLEKILETPAKNPEEIETKKPPVATTTVSQKAERETKLRKHESDEEGETEELVYAPEFEQYELIESSLNSPPISANNFKRNAICFLTPLLVTFLVKKQIGVEINSVSKVLAVALGYPLVQRIETAVIHQFYGQVRFGYDREYLIGRVAGRLHDFVFKYLAK